MGLDIKTWSEEILRKIDQKIEAQCGRLDGIIPYISENGRYTDVGEENLSWWTNGFWGGILWQLYHATGKDIYRNHAQALEVRLDQALEDYENLHHDVGFQWLHTAVANYRLTGNERSKVRGMHAANLLAGRYNPSGKFINAWNAERSGWMIIDCLMNLPLLHWGKEVAGLPHLAFIAKEHADTTLRVLLRPDGSSHHIGVMDVESGELVKSLTGQGFAPNSSWSRGQAWAIYGFALSHVYTGEQQYLDAAKKVAHYFMGQVSGTDFVPLVDFRAPKKPMNFDTAAGMIATCGMLEISKHVPEHEKDFYFEFALKMIKSMEAKYANWNIDEDSIISHGTVAYHDDDGSGIHVPIIYGDYFFIEAILRLQGKDFLIW